MGGGLDAVHPSHLDLVEAWWHGDIDGLDWNQLGVLMRNDVLVMTPTGPRLSKRATEALQARHAKR
jgi:hypothetical protein